MSIGMTSWICLSGLAGSVAPSSSILTVGNRQMVLDSRGTGRRWMMVLDEGFCALVDMRHWKWQGHWKGSEGLQQCSGASSFVLLSWIFWEFDAQRLADCFRLVKP